MTRLVTSAHFRSAEKHETEGTDNVLCTLHSEHSLFCRCFPFQGNTLFPAREHVRQVVSDLRRAIIPSYRHGNATAE